jgi:hypothetical protein
MGIVWRARDEVLGREVAVKEVRAPAGLAAVDEQRLYARLEREAWAAARVSHRNVVTVYDVAAEDGRPWIVMELIRGVTLSDALDAEGPVPPRRAAHIGAEVLAALRAAHEAGVLHRDVKPGNVLLANDGRVVLTDFGIAAVEGTSPLTMTGELIGSPEFLAPERALGRTPGPASDLWSLGVLLYAAVEGNSPFRRNTPLSTLRAAVDEELPPPRRAGPLTPVIEGLLRKDPAERLSADEAAHRLRVVGAGGGARTGPVAASDTSAATVAAFPPEVPAGPAGPRASGSTIPAAQPARQSRRAVAVLVAGAAFLLLAVGGLVYGLLREQDPGGTKGGATAGGAGAPGRAPPPRGADVSASAGTPSEPAPSTATRTPPPHRTVLVHVRPERGDYSGTCPPPAGRAPAFTGTITVGRTPVSVGYRWVGESHEESGSAWRTLEFGAGEHTEQQVAHTVAATHGEGGTYRDRVRLEVRSPVAARSNWVGFSVTCDDGSPTGGPPSSPGHTVTPSP